METLIITQHEVRELLPMGDCIRVVRGALAGLANDEGIQPLRPVMWLPERVGALGMMPGYLGTTDTLGIKTVTVFPGNSGTEFDSHQGSVMLFDAANGRLKAVIDATEITTIRTAAASAVATDLLARSDASIMAIIGSGVQAGSHLEAIPYVRPISEVRVWSPQPKNAQRLAESASAVDEVRAVASVAEALAGADIVCTTTTSSEPVIPGGLIEPGMHINAVGSSVPVARELDGEAMARSRLFVDRRESTVNESGDYLMALAEGAIDDGHIVAEIGELLIGAAEGRRRPEEITLFKSLGVAVEDLAAADLIYRNASASGVGMSIELGGVRHG